MVFFFNYIRSEAFLGIIFIAHTTVDGIMSATTIITDLQNPLVPKKRWLHYKEFGIDNNHQ